MLNPISWLKYRLSHINQDSWQYGVAKYVWGERRVKGKACSYYWYKLPLALLAYGVVMLIFIGAGGIIGFFLGFFLNLHGEDEHDLFHPYKVLPNGKRIPIAPWEIAVVVWSAYILYQLAIVHPSTGLLMGKAALVSICLIIAIVGVFFGISKGWANPLIRGSRQAIIDAWNKVCPELVPEDRSQGATGEHPQTIE